MEDPVYSPSTSDPQEAQEVNSSSESSLTSECPTGMSLQGCPQVKHSTSSPRRKRQTQKPQG
eukprot:151536-Amphidinium_carterae.1